MNFEICPYNSTKFIYEGKSPEEVKNSMDKKIDPAIKYTIAGGGTAVIITATVIGTATAGPIGGLAGFLWGSIGALFTPAIPVCVAASMDHDRLKTLYENTKKIHAYELERLHDIQVMASTLLGRLGQTENTITTTQSKELIGLENEISYEIFCSLPDTIEKTFLQFKKIQTLREEIFNTEARKIKQIATTVFQKITEFRIQKAALAKKLGVSETTSYSPKPDPIFTQPAGLMPEVRQLQIHSHIATLRDLQNLAICVLQVAGAPVPSINNTVTQANKELEAGNVDSASRLEKNAFNTVYQHATRAINKHKGDLKTLKRLEEQQALSNAIHDVQETAQSVAEIVTLIKPS